jgi:hypothetical protein
MGTAKIAKIGNGKIYLKSRLMNFLKESNGVYPVGMIIPTG